MSANPTNGSWRGFGRGGANVLGTCCLLLLTCCRNSFRIWFSTNLQSCEKEHPKSAFFHLRKFGMQRRFLRSSLFSFFFFFFLSIFCFAKKPNLHLQVVFFSVQELPSRNWPWPNPILLDPEGYPEWCHWNYSVKAQNKALNVDDRCELERN